MMDTVKIFSSTSLEDLETRINTWAEKSHARIVSAQTVLGPTASSGQVDYFLVTVVYTEGQVSDG